jgi:hypothetical protein
VFNLTVLNQPSFHIGQSLLEGGTPLISCLVNSQFVFAHCLLVLLSNLLIKIHIYLSFSVDFHYQGVSAFPNGQDPPINELLHPNFTVVE